MTAAGPHAPVMLPEVVAALSPEGSEGLSGRRIVDATFGAGGYAKAFLNAGASVVAFDRDPGAAAFADPLRTACPGRFRWLHRPFSELEAGLAEAVGEQGLCDGVAFDLGVSSMQVDEAARGFSFMRDGPLDMRMGREGPSAADLVNETPIADLARTLRLYGEEPQARRISSVLVRRRAETPFTRTLDLAETVERAVGGRRGAATHPATRTFQALRIAVNDELGELEAGLAAAEQVLAPGGRLAVVSFHSLEDRIVKAFLTQRCGRTPAGSRHRPQTTPAPAPSFALLFTGARGPGEAEIAANPRARSAKLRAAVRTPAPGWSRPAESHQVGSAVRGAKA